MPLSSCERKMPGTGGTLSAARHSATGQRGENTVIYYYKLMYLIYHYNVMCVYGAGEGDA
jgi:hypothetical protein